MTCDLLVITGAKTRMVEAGEAIHRWQFSNKMKHLTDARVHYFQSKVDLNSCRELASGQCSIIKMEETDNPMGKTGDKVAEAFVLFAQVVSYL